MVKDSKVCMLITNEINAENLSDRPMSISKIAEDGTMWFFTKA
jgi:general stress protein 26